MSENKLFLYFLILIILFSLLSSTVFALTPSYSDSGGGSSGIASSKCLMLDGQNDYVNVGDKPSLVMADAFTIEAHIYPTAIYGMNHIIVNKEGEYEIAIRDGTIQFATANTNPGWNWINSGY